MNVRLFGTEGGASLNPFELYRNGAPGEEYQIVTEPDVPTRFPHDNRFHNFINVLLGREELCATTEQVLCVQQILDAIYESSASGREVVLAEKAS
jgi:predicted dehydrogenase